jgi:hypothetical protein
MYDVSHKTQSQKNIWPIVEEYVARKMKFSKCLMQSNSVKENYHNE